MKEQRKKKKKRVRQRDWTTDHEDAFSHDRRKHQKTTGAISADVVERNAPPEFTPNGLVISQSGKWAFVEFEGEERQCFIHETLFEGRTSTLTTGDEVLIEFHNDEPMVRAMASRRTKLCRLSARSEQVIVANVDCLVIVTSVAQPMFKMGIVDRYLVIAQAGGVEPILCINKIDLAGKEPEQTAMYRDLGLPVFTTSCETGAGIEALRAALENKRSVLAGQSGVGKSSLLNAFEPGLDLYTQEVSEGTEKGRHTTSASRVYKLSGNTRIIDTPGIRRLGLSGVSVDELDLYFPDFQDPDHPCKFRNCTHIHEPSCAVRQQVDDGQISRLRYESYLRIRTSIEEGHLRY